MCLDNGEVIVKNRVQRDFSKAAKQMFQICDEFSAFKFAIRQTIVPALVDELYVAA